MSSSGRHSLNRIHTRSGSKSRSQVKLRNQSRKVGLVGNGWWDDTIWKVFITRFFCSGTFAPAAAAAASATGFYWSALLDGSSRWFESGFHLAPRATGGGGGGGGHPWIRRPPVRFFSLVQILAQNKKSTPFSFSCSENSEAEEAWNSLTRHAHEITSSFRGSIFVPEPFHFLMENLQLEVGKSTIPLPTDSSPSHTILNKYICMYGWMEGRTDGRTDGRMDGRACVSCHSSSSTYWIHVYSEL